MFALSFFLLGAYRGLHFHQSLTARIPEREIYSDLARDGLTVFDHCNMAAFEQQQAWLPLVREVEKPWSTASEGFQSHAIPPRR